MNSKYTVSCVWKSFVFIPVLGLLATGMLLLNVQENQAMEDSAKMLRHVVLFKYKDGTSDEKLEELVLAFKALPSKISSVAAFEWGTNNSPEGLADGFTHCYFLTFQSEAGRDEYLKHPAHEEFVGMLRPHLDKVLVVDYWAEVVMK